MFADPSQPCAHGPGLVHDGLNINARLALSFRPLLPNPGEERAQLFSDHLVIIVAPCVTRNLARRSIRGVLVRRVVVERDDYKRARLWKQKSGVCALGRLARHPWHLALVSATEPLLQARA